MPEIEEEKESNQLNRIKTEMDLGLDLLGKSDIVKTKPMKQLKQRQRS